MGLLARKKPKPEAFAVFDIGAASVGGAYACRAEDGTLDMPYATRVTIEPAEGESAHDATVRSLAFLCGLMTTEGAPGLRRAVGSASVAHAAAVLRRPWQSVALRTAAVRAEKPFAFARKHLELPKDGQPIPEGWRRSDPYLVSATLNGYAVADPFGKKATRAEAVVLVTDTDAAMADAVERTVARALGTRTVLLESFPRTASQALARLCPHERDYLLLEVGPAATEALLVKRGLLAGVGGMSCGTAMLAEAVARAAPQSARSVADMNAGAAPAGFDASVRAIEASWTSGLRAVLAAFGKENALPRRLFLLADGGSRDYLKRLIDASDLGSLRLADEGLETVALAPAALSGAVRYRGTDAGDPALALLALGSV